MKCAKDSGHYPRYFAQQLYMRPVKPQPISRLAHKAVIRLRDRVPVLPSPMGNDVKAEATIAASASRVVALS